MVNFTEYQMINNITNLQNHANNEIVARLDRSRLSRKKNCIKIYIKIYFRKLQQKKLRKKRFTQCEATAFFTL